MVLGWFWASPRYFEPTFDLKTQSSPWPRQCSMGSTFSRRLSRPFQWSSGGHHGQEVQHEAEAQGVGAAREVLRQPHLTLARLMAQGTKARGRVGSPPRCDRRCRSAPRASRRGAGSRWCRPGIGRRRGSSHPSNGITKPVRSSTQTPTSTYVHPQHRPFKLPTMRCSLMVHCFSRAGKPRWVTHKVTLVEVALRQQEDNALDATNPR